MEKVSLATLNGGAVTDLFNAELEKILENIEDENTQPTAVRSVSIKVEIKPDKTRRTGTTRLSVSSKLASVKPQESLLYFDSDAGELAAFEDNPRQEVLAFEEPKKIPFGG